MTAQIQRRVALLGSRVAGPERLTVLTRSMGDGPWKGELFFVRDLSNGGVGHRDDNETVERFKRRIRADGGPSFGNETNEETK